MRAGVRLQSRNLSREEGWGCTREPENQRKLTKQEEVWTFSKVNELSGESSCNTLLPTADMSFRANYSVLLPLKLWCLNVKLIFPLKYGGFLWSEMN